MKLRMKDTDKEKISMESLFFLHLLPFFLLHDVVTCVFILWVIEGQENLLFISSKTLSHILSLIPLSDFSQKRDRKDGFIVALSFMRQHCFLSTWTGRMQDTERLCVYPFNQSGETMWGSHAFPPASSQGLCYSVLLPWITCDKEGVLVKHYLASNTLIFVGHILLHTSLKWYILMHLPPHPLYSLGFLRSLGSLVVFHKPCYQLYNTLLELVFQPWRVLFLHWDNEVWGIRLAPGEPYLDGDHHGRYVENPAEPWPCLAVELI